MSVTALDCPSQHPRIGINANWHFGLQDLNDVPNIKSTHCQAHNTRTEQLMCSTDYTKAVVYANLLPLTYTPCSLYTML